MAGRSSRRTLRLKLIRQTPISTSCTLPISSTINDSGFGIPFADRCRGNELHETLKEEVSQSESKNLRLLLEKSSHIIERLKFKSETGVLRSLPF